MSDTHTTDSANRLTDDADYTYVYDLNGNLTGRLGKAGSGLPQWGYTYSALDELLSVTRDGAVVERYRYDAFGRRSVIETANDNTLAILNDGSDRAIDLVNDGAGAGALILLRRYTHSDNIDEPLQLESFDAAGTFDAAYTYHADHLGSVRFLTDAAGTIVNAYDYDSYGRPQLGIISVEQPFAYTGREWDEASELYHYRARAYDPGTGRFLQEDPIGFVLSDLEQAVLDLSADFSEGLQSTIRDYSRLGAFPNQNISLYRYVENNPVNYVDETGLILGSYANRAKDSAVQANLMAGVLRAGVKKQASRQYARAIAAAKKGASATKNFAITNGPCGAAFAAGYSKMAFDADFGGALNDSIRLKGCYSAGQMAGFIGSFFGGPPL